MRQALDKLGGAPFDPYLYLTRGFAPDTEEFGVAGGSARQDTFYAPSNFGAHRHIRSDDGRGDDDLRLCADPGKTPAAEEARYQKAIEHFRAENLRYPAFLDPDWRDDSHLMWGCEEGDCNEAQAALELQERAQSYPNLEEWKARAASIRQGLLRESNLDPLPAKTPLRPIFQGRRDYDGYSVENVAFESLPGFFVTGNLYRPLGRKGPVPGVLSPHGHSFTSARVRPDMQIRCAQFARAGAVVFAWDMVGHGESTQTTHEDPNVLTLQTWNSMRAVDFLLSLDEVDPERIAITGISGGATQALYLTALDDRITLSIPVSMVSAHFAGGCPCERNSSRTAGPEVNNVEVAALAAPRPQLLISAGFDWTKNTPEVEFPHVRNVYRLYEAEALVTNAHFPDEGHEYGSPQRAAASAFLTRHFGLDPLNTESAMAGDTNPPGVTIEWKAALYVFDEGQPRPPTALEGHEAIAAALFAGRNR